MYLLCSLAKHLDRRKLIGSKRVRADFLRRRHFSFELRKAPYSMRLGRRQEEQEAS